MTLDSLEVSAQYSDGTLEDAVLLSQSDRRFRIWQDWLQSILQFQNNSGSKNLVDANLGKDFEFPTPQFFERTIESYLEKIGLTVETQFQEKLLGGSVWVAGGETVDSEVELNAKNYSRPDLLVSGGGIQKKILVECKYKELDPTVLANGLCVLRGFDRADRNQLLSFVLSSSEDLAFDSTKIVVVFPQDPEAPSTKPIARLKFRARHEPSRIQSITWNRGNAARDASLISITFVPVDLVQILRFLGGGNPPDNEPLAKILLQSKTKSAA